MYQAGITDYIKYKVKKPRFSEIIWRTAVTDEFDTEINELFSRENVKLILTHQLVIRPMSVANDITFSSYTNALFTFDATGILSELKILDFRHIYNSNRLYLYANSTDIQFSLSFQLIVEGE